MKKLSAIQVRNKARNGENFTTSGLAEGFVQTNVVIIPKEERISISFNLSLE